MKGSNRSPRMRNIGMALAMGLGLTLLQILFAVTAQERVTTLRAYSRLWQWDSEHYMDIAEHGYRSALPKDRAAMRTLEAARFIEGTNVAFFPGYPLFARFIKTITGLPMKVAMLVAAQWCAVLFWTLLILLLQQWKIPRSVQVGTILLIATYPSAYFLITGYAESLFLVNLIAYLFLCDLWMKRSDAKTATSAAVAGILMTFTRLEGLIMAGYPLLRSLCKDLPRFRFHHFWRSLLLCVSATAGAVAFFVFCSVKFGDPLLYFLVQNRAWSVTPMPFFFLRWPMRVLFPFFGGHPLRAMLTLGVLSAGVWMMIGLAAAEIFVWKKWNNDGWRTRVPLLLLAGINYYMHASPLLGKSSVSLVRYNLTTHILLMLATSHLIASLPKQKAWVTWSTVAVAVIVAAGSLVVQSIFIQHFATRTWVG